jgi:hypothetical protein
MGGGQAAQIVFLCEKLIDHKYRIKSQHHRYHGRVIWVRPEHFAGQAQKEEKNPVHNRPTRLVWMGPSLGELLVQFIIVQNN